MIKVRQYTPQQIKLYDPSNNFVGYVNNEIEFLNVIIDIVTLGLEGYYFFYGSIQMNIRRDGTVENMPFDLYTKSSELKYKFLELRNK